MFKKQKVDESEVMKFGFLGGIAEATYIVLVALLIFMIGQRPPVFLQGIYGFIVFLLIFVFSAAISAVLVFGYPAYLATQKRFAESLMTLMTTIVTLAIIAILMVMWVSMMY